MWTTFDPVKKMTLFAVGMAVREVDNLDLFAVEKHRDRLVESNDR